MTVVVEGGGVISLSECGRRLGVSPQAISKGVRSRRLSRSVGQDEKGRPVIVDFELAKQEWKANAGRTRTSVDAGVAPSSKILRPSERFEIVRTARAVVIVSRTSVSPHADVSPNTFIDSAVSAASFGDVEDSLVSVMSVETARELARLLIDKADGRPDLENFPG